MKFERAVMSVGGWTLISRIFGYLRDIAIAFYLGASVFNDAFIIALRLPNMFRSIFAEGALNNVFVPIFSSKLKRDGLPSALSFARNIQVVLLVALISCSVLIMCNMSTVIGFLARGYVGSNELMNLATNLGLISFPYIVFISLTAFYGGISNSFGNFLPFATAPIILNIMLIGFIFFGETQLEKTYWLTISLPIAGLFEMLWVMYFVIKKVGYLGLKVPSFDHDTKVFFRRFSASIIGSGITQINLIISTTIGSFTLSGISYLYYADRIYQLPLALIGTALGTVILPELAKRHAKSDLNKFKVIKHRASSFVIFTTLPCTFGLYLLAEEIISTLFQYGAFDKVAAEQTAQVLKVFALGLPMYCYIKIFSSSFFAIGDTKTPVKIAAVSLVINASVSFLLFSKFQYVAVAIASILTAYITAFIMGYILYKKELFVMFRQSIRIKLKILLSCVIMSLSIIAMRHFIKIELKVIELTVYLFVSGIVYLGCCHLLKAYSLKKLFRK